MSFQEKFEENMARAMNSVGTLEDKVNGNADAEAALKEIKAELEKVKASLEARRANKTAKQ
jgi:hypothetical protein